MRTAAQMRRLIDAWEGSELTQREFAEQKGLTYAAFQYWRRRLKALDEAEQPVLVPLRVVKSCSVAAGSDRIEVRVGKDVSISIPPGFDELEMRRVLEVVRAC